MKSRFGIALACLSALLFAPIAHAADVAVKATPRAFTYPVGCGFYYGAMSSAAAGGASTTTVSGVQALAGDIGLLAGYTCPIGASSFWFAEGIASVSKLNGGDSSAGLKLSGSASFEQRFGIGVPFSVVQTLIQAVPALGGTSVPSIPTLPGGITTGAINPYIFIGVNERDVSAQLLLDAGKAWLVSGEVGFGALTRLSNGMVIDSFVKYQPASTKLKLGPTNNFQTGDFVGGGIALKL